MRGLGSDRRLANVTGLVWWDWFWGFGCGIWVLVLGYWGLFNFVIFFVGFVLSLRVVFVSFGDLGFDWGWFWLIRVRNY